MAGTLRGAAPSRDERRDSRRLIKAAHGLRRAPGGAIADLPANDTGNTVSSDRLRFSVRDVTAAVPFLERGGAPQE
jgi:hypothetical protein